MKWTREERYRNYNSVTPQELEHLTLTTNNSIWRQTYHVQPIYGLLNDPNGFSFFNGQYHLFYQWFPLGAAHGLKNWYHTVSTDLVNFKNVGLALQPEYDQESHGIFSGSGIVHNDNLYLFYTGNKRDVDWQRYSSQCLAIMDNKGDITKLKQPVITHQPQNYTSDFRDPKVLNIDGTFYMVVGGQRENQTGCVLVYYSNDLINWSWRGELKTNLVEFGFMWECPDLFKLEDKYVLLISPQGLKPSGNQYNNHYHSVALIGELDINTLQFSVETVQELDGGFDFYAPQTTNAPDQRRLLVGWMGLPDINYPSDKDNWANCLTIIRELSLKDGKIIQKPVREFAKKRKHLKAIELSVNGVENLTDFKCRYGEMFLTLNNQDAKVSGLNFCISKQEQTTIKIDWQKQQIILDRSKTGYSVAQEYGEQRIISYQKNSITLQIFLDTSSVEIFINDGEFVLTSRIFPSKISDNLQLFSNNGTCDVSLKQWRYVN